MDRIIVKDWIYEEAQVKAQKYNYTLLWNRATMCEDNELASVIDDKLFCLFGDVERETEKAILVNCSFWNLRKAGRYVTDAPIENGFKVWLPKSAVINIKTDDCMKIADTYYNYVFFI